MAEHTTADHEDYYVPEQSKLAICATIGLVLSVFGAASVINDHTYRPGEDTNSSLILIGGMIFFAATLFVWFKTTIVENIKGMNSAQLKRSYVIGMQWFIFSEAMFFFAFFGALFYVRNLAGPWLAGQGEAGAMNGLLWEGFEYSWPLNTTPQQAVGGAGNQVIANTGTFNGATGTVHWNHLPLYNTILLVASSVTVHIAHHALKEGKRSKFNWMLGITLLLGFVFVGVQALEYYEAMHDLGLTLGAGIYGSTFYMLTGFHGFHVCMGAFMLSIQWIRSLRGHFTEEDHFGFEASSWYWHFVDVVWVGLFLFVYII